jgi:hypothetical protein
MNRGDVTPKNAPVSRDFAASSGVQQKLIAEGA